MQSVDKTVFTDLNYDLLWKFPIYKYFLTENFFILFHKTSQGIPLVKLTATDSDEGVNSQLTFHLLDESKEKDIFTVDPHTGELSLLPTVDPFIIGGRYQLKFEVQIYKLPIIIYPSIKYYLLFGKNHYF